MTWRSSRAAIVKSRPRVRNLLIAGLFLGVGCLIYFSAEPFAGSLLAVSAAIGVPSLRVRAVGGALRLGVSGEGVGVLLGTDRPSRSDGPDEHGLEQHQPVDAAGRDAAHRLLDQPRARSPPSRLTVEQKLELLMTLGQSLVGMLFLVNMQLTWWEAGALFSLWFIQFAFSPFTPGPGFVGFMAKHIHSDRDRGYTLCGSRVGLLRTLFGKRKTEAFHLFAGMWRKHVWPTASS